MTRWLNPALGWSYRQPLLRGISFLLACVLFAWFSIWPASFTHLPHGVLSLTMLGISGCFVQGVGFEPLHPVPRILFSPFIAWPLLALRCFSDLTLQLRCMLSILGLSNMEDSHAIKQR